MSQLAHVQVLSAYWIPLTLLGLHLFLRRGQWRWAALFATSWWLQSLANGYYFFFLSVLVGLWLIWFVVAARRWSILGKILLAWSVAGLAFVPVALGYLKWQRANGFRRWPDEIQAFSADVASVLSTSSNLRLWGWLNVIDRPESQLFPGAHPFARDCGWRGARVDDAAARWCAAPPNTAHPVRARRHSCNRGRDAAVGSVPGGWKSSAFACCRSAGTKAPVAHAACRCHCTGHASVDSSRLGTALPLAFYTIAAAIMWMFCLGPRPTLLHQPLLYKAPYSWLMLLPGVEGVRVPARFWVLATMCLAVAGGLACVHIATRWPALRHGLPGLVARAAAHRVVARAGAAVSAA